MVGGRSHPITPGIILGFDLTWTTDNSHHVKADDVQV